MSWWDYKSTIDKGVDIIDQFVDDGDLNMKLKAQFYLAELRTKTIPIFDALHKVGRQFLALVQVGFYGWCTHKGIEITWELVAGVSGATGAYTLAKGKGQ